MAIDPAEVAGTPAASAAGAGIEQDQRGRLHDLRARGPVLEPAVPPRPATWLSLPSAESLGVRGPGAFALPGGGLLTLPESLPVPGRSRARGHRPESLGARLRAVVGALVGDLPWLLTVVSVSGVALAMRLISHSTDYDVFIDEITYSTIGQAVALGHGVTLYGPPFFLHPPLFFYLEGGVLDLFGGANASPVNLVLELRPINCVIGAVDCALVMLLIRRFANRPAAIVVGIFVAIDPFLLLWDGRVLLETMAMTFAVAGWLCLDWVARNEQAASDHAQSSRRAEETIIAIGGLLFGASLLSKETYAFVGVVPLLGMLIIGSPVRRRVTGLMFTIAVGCYAMFLLSVLADGRISAWWHAQIGGVARVVGTKEITGFNQAGHHASVGGRVGANLSLYLVSYLVIIAIGLAAAIGVLRWFRAWRAGRPVSSQRRLAIALGVGCVGYVGYAVMFGAFEVQIFYMCIVGGLPVLATETLSTSNRLTRRLNRRGILVACAVVACAALAFEVSADVRLRTTKDTSLPQLVSYVDQHVHYPALVDSTDQVSAFLLKGVRIDSVDTVSELEHDQPDYVVVDAGLVDQGYVALGPGFQQWLNAHAHAVFTTTSRSTGEILLYRTQYARTLAGAHQ